MIRKGQWVTQFPQGKVIEVDLVGAGCLLIHRQVLEKLPPSRPEAGKTFFDWKVDMMGMLPPGEALSEDFTFNFNCYKHLGFKPLVDTSIRCRHIGYGESDYGSFKPMEVQVQT
jgi:hypothetical protein